MKEFRNLRADEIQIRPTDTKYKGSALLLLYKDARCDMAILDETVGPMNWKKSFYSVNGNLYCSVAIKDDNGEWVSKDDCGIESNMDAAKGEASDAFKRACFNWGLGRELYTCPKIRIKCSDNYYQNDKFSMAFTVQNIEYVGKAISKLVIADKNGDIVYTYGGNQPKQQAAAKTNNTTTAKTNNNEMIPKWLYAQTMNAKTESELRALWDANANWQWNNNFKSLMIKRKTAITA